MLDRGARLGRSAASGWSASFGDEFRGRTDRKGALVVRLSVWVAAGAADSSRWTSAVWCPILPAFDVRNCGFNLSEQHGGYKYTLTHA